MVGRARHQASALSSELRKLGARVLEIPFIEIRRPKSYRALDDALRHLSEYDWLILTSVNGVEAFWRRMKALHLGLRRLSHLKIAAIGPATRRAIEEHGLKVQVMPGEYIAEAVVSSLRAKVNGKRVLLARAKAARDVIPRELRKERARVDVVEAYETVIPKASRRRLRALLRDERKKLLLITFTSSSSARNFVTLLNGRGGPRQARLPRGLTLASIGPVTSSTLRSLGLKVDIEAREYTIPGMIRAILAYRRKNNRAARPASGQTGVERPPSQRGHHHSSSVSGGSDC